MTTVYFDALSPNKYLYPGEAVASPNGAATGGLDGVVVASFVGTATGVAAGAASGTGPLDGVAVTPPGGSATGGAAGAGTITTEPIKNNTGTLLTASGTVTAFVHAVSTGALVVKKTGLSLVAGVLTITDAAIVPGTVYRVIVVIGSGEGLATYTAT